MVPAIIGPEMVRNIELEAYATIGCTAVLLWDILLHVAEDYQQIRNHGFFRLSRIIYCFSRFTCLFYMIALCVVETVPIGNCAWIRYIAYLFPLTIPVTLLLFLCRVYAIFRKENPYIPIFVFLSWLLVFGSSVVVAVRTNGMNVNGTRFCTKRIDMRRRDVSDSLSTFTRFFHDTMVFVVTSWWLFKNGEKDERTGFRAVVLGKNLLPLARSLLHDGQAYYLATLILNVIVIVLPLLPKPFVTPCTLGGPLFVLISNMAAHVYRNLISKTYRDHSKFLKWENGEWMTEDEVESRNYRNGNGVMERGGGGGGRSGGSTVV